MRKQNPFIYGVILIAVAVLQNTVLTPLQISQVRPDFTFLLLLFFAHQLGSMEGMLIGFFAGITMDLLGIAPLGFHSLIYTVIGHVFGLTRGKMYVDAITMPVIFAIGGSLLVLFTTLLISLLFLPLRIPTVLSVSVLIQFGMHALLAPFIFGLLRVLKLCRERDTQML
jgi:rod shape-determining protein MreD